MRRLIAHLAHEKEVLSLTQKISEDAQEVMGKQQREYLLRQQLEAIRRELGETDETQAEAPQYRKRSTTRACRRRRASRRCAS